MTVTAHDERRFYHILIRVTFILVSLATLLAMLGSVYWIAELFTHFRFYFLLVQALLVLIFLHSHHYRSLCLTLLLTIPNAWYVGPYLAPLMFQTSVAEARNDELEIVAINVNFRNTDYHHVHRYLAAHSPDVVVIEELTGGWLAALEYLEADYPYHIVQHRNDPWGIGVYSRLPFVEAELFDLGVPGNVQARVVLDTTGGPVEIFAVHLYPPVSAELASQRNRQLTQLAQRVISSKYAPLVVGDLNLTPFSPYFARFAEAAGVSDARLPAGFHITWPTSALPLWIPIDHAFADPSLDVRKVSRGPRLGSDHYPLEVSIDCCTSEDG